ncbi:MAG: endolytic transglycosylase MltG [Candidatus Eisenbacteria bacterium]
MRRASDARGARPTQRAFRPLRWAWLLLLVALLAPAYDLFLPAGYQPPRERRTVVIERGQSLHEISRELQRVGVIRSQVGFLVLARAMRLDRSVKAGQYSFRLGMTVPALLRALDRGMFGLNLVTIPEGLMVSETAALIERKVGIPASALEALATDPALLDSLEIGAPTLEGWLAPDSYEWLPGTSPEVVLRTMVARTRERVQRATAGYDSLPLGMNMHEVLTLASIVESESRAKEERPHIARVYLNRLERGMLLQADPTVGYALGRGPRSRLTFKDLRVASPYNTYRHEGLPPGPICSPGEEAIAGVMNATEGVNDLYFVARGQGRHLFAPTYEQHLANIAYVRGKQAAMEARSNPEAASDAGPDSSGAARTAGTPSLASAPVTTPSTNDKPTHATTTRPASPLAATTTKPAAAPVLAPNGLLPKPHGTNATPPSTPSTAARVTPDPNAPLKGTLLIPRGSIKAASTLPPKDARVGAHVDTGRVRRASTAKPDSAHAGSKPVVARPRPAGTDTAHVRRKSAAKPDSAHAAKPAAVRSKPAAKPAAPDSAQH